ncbi:MAG: tripartite tricarboxylate transporter substrate binding protein [Thermodesulfobacteriota bacterium]
MRKMILFGMLAGVLGALTSLSLAAFPEKPIQIVNPYAAGGETDMILRIIANAAPPHFGQSVVVVNKTGGGGSVGMQYGAKSKADGYTIVSGSLATLLLHPQMEKMPYSYNDFKVIGQFGISQIGLFSKAEAPWKDFQGFVKYAKENPGEIKYGSAGAGTIGHLLMESISLTAGGLKMTHVPFAGSAPALTSLAGGHIHVTIGDVPPAVPLIEAKQISPLVITNTQRVKTLANIPALPELGYRGVDVWKALLVPKETPVEVVKYLEKALEATLKDQNCIDPLAKIGQEPDFIGAEKFTPKMMEDDKWLAEIVNKLGLAKK